MNEPDRLRQYYPFDNDILQQVSAVADAQRQQSWREASTSLPQPQLFRPAQGKPVEVVDFNAHDYDNVQVYHLSMACGLDANILWGLATLAAAEPRTRLIAVGNPGAIGRKTGRLRFGELLGVWHGDLRATVTPTLEYLQTKGITEATHIGYSYGADKAAAAVSLSPEFGQTVTHAVFMDPAAVVTRSLRELTKAFKRAGKPLEDYVQASASPAYLEARRITHRQGHGKAGYMLGMLRATNVVIGHALSGDGFEARAHAALAAHPDMHAAIIWGTDSELAVNTQMQALTQRLAQRFGRARVSTLALPNQRHAMGCDIFLHDAMVLQALKGRP